jgi:N-acetylmuramoyl-L-alanine amidase
MNQKSSQVPSFIVALSLLAVIASPGCAEKPSQAPSSDRQQISQLPSTSAAEPGPREPVGVEHGGILIPYPRDGAEINSASTFVIGAVPPQSTLTANGAPVRVNAQGYFAHVVPLHHGANKITLVRNGLPQNTFELSIRRPSPPAPVPAAPTQILRTSLQPSDEVGVNVGDLIPLSFRGSPGGAARVQIGNRSIPLYGPGKKPSVNLGLDTAYGVSVQRSASSIKDMYTGFYRIQADDRWQQVRPKYFLSKGGKTVQMEGSGRLTVLGQPFVAVTKHNDTIVRVAPGAARLTPFYEGVRVLVDGWKGKEYRCEMFPGKHVWILKEDLEREDGGPIPPTATIRTVNLEPEGNSGARVVIPLDQRLPYQVEQQVNPNKLVLRIYGGIADTDWITPGTGQSDADVPGEQTSKTFPQDRRTSPINFVTWRQVADRFYQGTIELNQKQQWGYGVTYEGTNLVLHIKGAPNLIPGSAGLTNLSGLIVCVDPGHGGSETGAIGCGGIKEATVNLAIGQRLQRQLEAAGARVVMTRTGDTAISLGDRVATAIAARADLLISIHNNALPDGRNPWTEKGTSTYWYHPQSIPLARQLKAGVISQTGFKDYGTRYQNLALCRPTQMPACLVEVGFMINPDEYAQLIDPAVQEQAARGVLKGVQNFLNASLPKPPVETQAGE